MFILYLVHLWLLCHGSEQCFAQPQRVTRSSTSVLREWKRTSILFARLKRSAARSSFSCRWPSLTPRSPFHSTFSRRQCTSLEAWCCPLLFFRFLLVPIARLLRFSDNLVWGCVFSFLKIDQSLLQKITVYLDVDLDFIRTVAAHRLW